MLCPRPSHRCLLLSKTSWAQPGCYSIRDARVEASPLEVSSLEGAGTFEGVDIGVEAALLDILGAVFLWERAGEVVLPSMSVEATPGVRAWTPQSSGHLRKLFSSICGNLAAQQCPVLLDAPFYPLAVYRMVLVVGYGESCLPGYEVQHFDAVEVKFEYEIGVVVAPGSVKLFVV